MVYNDPEMVKPGKYIMGPKGRWPYKYRVIIEDRGDREDVDADWYVRLQRATLSGRWKTQYGTKLFPEGQEYADRTQPAEY